MWHSCVSDLLLFCKVYTRDLHKVGSIILCALYRQYWQGNIWFGLYHCINYFFRGICNVTWPPPCQFKKNEFNTRIGFYWQNMVLLWYSRTHPTEMPLLPDVHRWGDVNPCSLSLFKLWSLFPQPSDMYPATSISWFGTPPNEIVFVPEIDPINSPSL